MDSNDQTQRAVDEILEVGKSFILPVGTPLQVEIEGISAKLNSIAVGWVPENYLIIKRPVSGFGSIASKLFNGNGITVRYLTGGDVFAFKSELIGSADALKLIFVAFPKQVVRRCLRECRRLLCFLPAELMKQTGDSDLIQDSVSGILSDISVAGCAFEMIKGADGMGLPDIKTEDLITLRVHFPGQGQPVEFPGQVRRSHRDGKRLSLGIRFQETNALTKASLDSYLRTLEKFA